MVNRQTDECSAFKTGFFGSVSNVRQTTGRTLLTALSVLLLYLGMRAWRDRTGMIERHINAAGDLAASGRIAISKGG